MTEYNREDFYPQRFTQERKSDLDNVHSSEDVRQKDLGAKGAYLYNTKNEPSGNKMITRKMRPQKTYSV